MRTKYNWNVKDCYKKDRRGSKTIACFSEGDTSLKIVEARDGYDLRIYEDGIPSLSKELLHREAGTESQILLAEDIYEAYKKVRDNG